jgi:hypothetical protein
MSGRLAADEKHAEGGASNNAEEVTAKAYSDRQDLNRVRGGALEGHDRSV